VLSAVRARAREASARKSVRNFQVALVEQFETAAPQGLRVGPQLVQSDLAALRELLSGFTFPAPACVVLRTLGPVSLGLSGLFVSR
jgi:hypothetical protein